MDLSQTIFEPWDAPRKPSEELPPAPIPSVVTGPDAGGRPSFLLPEHLGRAYDVPTLVAVTVLATALVVATHDLMGTLHTPAASRGLPGAFRVPHLTVAISQRSLLASAFLCLGGWTVLRSPLLDSGAVRFFGWTLGTVAGGLMLGSALVLSLGTGWPPDSPELLQAVLAAGPSLLLLAGLGLLAAGAGRALRPVLGMGSSLRRPRLARQILGPCTLACAAFLMLAELSAARGGPGGVSPATLVLPGIATSLPLLAAAWFTGGAYEADPRIIAIGASRSPWLVAGATVAAAGIALVHAL